MMSLISTYLEFILRPLPNHGSGTGMDIADHFYHRLASWTIFFVGMFYFFRKVPKKFFPEWYQNLSERKKKEFPAYAACLIHHVTLVPRAWVHIFQDFQRTSAEIAMINYPALESSIAPFCLGYLLGDTICFALPELFRGHLEYIIHHILTTWLIMSSMFANGHLLRFIPHLLICDSSNLFFNTAWILRTVDSLQGSVVVMILELLFLFFFFVTRVINLPLAFYSLWHSVYSEGLGYSRYTLLPIACFQWYWFAIILSGMRSRLTGGGKGKGKEMKDKAPASNKEVPLLKKEEKRNEEEEEETEGGGEENDNNAKKQTKKSSGKTKKEN
jgi:hypothetical protein